MSSVSQVNRVVMVVPTYNEADNLRPIVARLRAAEPGVHVLVVDDNSPDGTGDLADELAQEENRQGLDHGRDRDLLRGASSGHPWPASRPGARGARPVTLRSRLAA